jgi:hypothetical protein
VSLRLNIKAQHHEGEWGSGGRASSLTSALDGGKWSVSRSGRSTPREGTLPVPIGQEGEWTPAPVWTRKIPYPCWESNPNRPTRSSSLYLVSYPGSSCDKYSTCTLLKYKFIFIGKGKSIPVTGSGGAHRVVRRLLDNRLTDGGEAVSFKRRPPFTPQKVSWHSFLLDAESTPGP